MLFFSQNHLQMTDPTQISTHVFDLTITFEIAKGNRRCRRCCTIQPKDIHLAVYKGGLPMRDNYCLSCAVEYLKETREKAIRALKAIDEIQDQLELYDFTG